MAYSYEFEAMDEEIRNRFERWWESEGRDNADKEGGQTCDLYKIKKVFREAWNNGSYVAQTEMIKRNMK